MWQTQGLSLASAEMQWQPDPWWVCWSTSWHPYPGRSPLHGLCWWLSLYPAHMVQTCTCALSVDKSASVRRPPPHSLCSPSWEKQQPYLIKKHIYLILLGLCMMIPYRYVPNRFAHAHHVQIDIGRAIKLIMPQSIVILVMCAVIELLSTYLEPASTHYDVDPVCVQS